MLKGPAGNVKLERSGGLDHLVGGEERSAFPSLLTPGSVDGGYCRIDNVDIEHLRGGHLEFDPVCTTCTSMMRRRQRRRQDDRETAGAGGEICADLTGRLPVAHNGSEYLLVALRRETHFGFVKALTNKRSETVKEAMVDMQLLLREVWRFLITRTCVAQVVCLSRAHHVSCVISMRSCVCSDSLRLLLFPLFADHLLSYHPVLPPAHQLHLPRCGGQIPCALSLMRTLAPPCRVRPSHRRRTRVFGRSRQLAERTCCPSHHNRRLRSKREQSCRRDRWCSKTWNSMSPTSSKRTCEPVARMLRNANEIYNHSNRPFFFDDK